LAGGALRILKNIRLPEPQHPPAKIRQHGVVALVSLPVVSDLGDPVSAVVAGAQPRFPLLPVPTVPKITIDKDRDALTPWPLAQHELLCLISLRVRRSKLDFAYPRD
jgi:hypothetical protein